MVPVHPQFMLEGLTQPQHNPIPMFNGFNGMYFIVDNYEIIKPILDI